MTLAVFGKHDAGSRSRTGRPAASSPDVVLPRLSAANCPSRFIDGFQRVPESRHSLLLRLTHMGVEPGKGQG